MYSGFELCESAALPGREEYLDSEKYQLRQRDWQAPGNIIAEISQLNQIRRGNPALQTHLSLRFYNASNDQYCGTANPPPDWRISSWCWSAWTRTTCRRHSSKCPLWEFGLPDHGVLQVEELMRGIHFNWYGKLQQWRFVPQELPFAIFRVQALQSPA